MRHLGFVVPVPAGLLAVGIVALAPSLVSRTACAAPPPVSIDDDVHVAAVAVGDLDRDGRGDVVAASYYGDELAWWRPRPDGTWARAQIGALNGATTVLLADLDGDGDDDVIATSKVDGVVRWYENRTEPGGPPEFTSHVVLEIDGSEPSSIAAGDLDGDGTTDLAIAYLYRPAVHVVYNRGGDGQAFAANLQTVPVPGNGVSWVRIEDLDRDGDLDLVAATPWDWVDDVNYYWFANEGPDDGDGDGDGEGEGGPAAASFGPLRVIAGRDGLHGAFAGALADLDGDGRLDLVTMSDWGQDNRTVNWFRCLDDEATQWASGVVIDDAFAGADGSRSLVCADVNGDGHQDVIAGSSFLDPALAVWTNRGGAAGFDRIDLAPGFAARGVAAADLDHDGRVEVVAGSWGFYTGEMRAWTICPACGSDLDDDCATGASDLTVLMSAWGPNPGHPADVDGDGVVGIGDLLALITAWGPC